MMSSEKMGRPKDPITSTSRLVGAATSTGHRLTCSGKHIKPGDEPNPHQTLAHTDHTSCRSYNYCFFNFIKMLKVFVLLAVVVCYVSAAATYTTKYDNIDLDEILSNQRLYKKYYDCLANKGKCTPDGKELKEALPDALKTNCAKCSKKQKEGTDKVLRYVLKNKSNDYDVLEHIYDPTGIYRKQYDAEASKHGIKLPGGH